MSPIRDFAARLAHGGADASKILQEIELTFEPGAMSRQNVNAIIHSVKAGLDTNNHCGKNTPQRTRTPEAISTVAALVDRTGGSRWSKSKLKLVSPSMRSI